MHHRWYILCVLTVCALSAVEIPTEARALLGTWAEDGVEQSYMRLEEERFLGNDVASGEIQFLRTSYTPKTIIFHFQGQTFESAFRLDGDRLIVVDSNGKDQAYTRHEGIPKELQIEALAFGKAKKLKKQQVKAIADELAQRLERDQAVRTDPKKRGEMGAVDADNTAWLRKLVLKLGWVDAKRFGAEAANAAFLIVQHSGDLPLMLAALPAIEADVKAKAIDGQGYALLYDRLQLRTGRKQRYGSQFSVGQDGVMSIFALEDKERVEQFRQEIGIFPLELYLKIIKQQTGVKKVVYLD